MCASQAKEEKRGLAEKPQKLTYTLEKKNESEERMRVRKKWR